MLFDYSKLRGRIVEKYGNQGAFAEVMDMSLSTLNLKLNNKSDWTAPEMVRACELLDINLVDGHAFFMAEKC